MPLTCYCDIDLDGWFYYAPSDYTVAPQGRRKRCKSCANLIDVGACCTEWARARYPDSDIEDRIYGEGCEIELTSYWLCETCSDLYFSLYELGFHCIGPTENMWELVKEYHRIVSAQ